jgi:hypothetical protein
MSAEAQKEFRCRAEFIAKFAILKVFLLLQSPEKPAAFAP